MRHIRVLFAVIAAFMVADVATTAVILANGGTELNPLARVWIRMGGIPALLLQKLVAFLMIGALVMLGVRHCNRYGHPKATYAYWSLGSFAAFPVAWNAAVIH